MILVLALACHDPAVSKLDQVRALGKPVTFADVTRVLGEPTRDLGSGIYILEYQQPDGTAIWVGTPDKKRVVYIQLVDGSGGRTDLYRE